MLKLNLSTENLLSAGLAAGLMVALAGTSLSVPEAGQVTEPPHAAILSLVFAILLGTMLMPVLVWAARVLIRFAWAMVKIVARFLRDEIIKWILLAGAASLGILQYLEWLPLFP